VAKTRISGLNGGISVVRAREADADTVLPILEEAARWLTSRGIEGWKPGSFSRRRILERIGRGEMYLAKLAGETFGTFALQWSEEEVWGDVQENAGYVHGLAIRRGFAGRGLGRELLRWAEERAALSSKSYLRLDCRADNQGLNEYYRWAGFCGRGRARVWGFEVTLYEKRVRPPDAPSGAG
jgi:ribosomal protein S18 acetylase RimI-like enzyme